MKKNSPVKNEIQKLLHTKSCIKQDIYKLTEKTFGQFKNKLKEQEKLLKKNLATDCITEIDVEYNERGDYLVELKFAGDILVFSMHTNVFNFENSHYIHQNSYIKKDPNNAYCGIINIYNFIADSFKYNRYDDLGYLIARVFINKEGRFFVEGVKELNKYTNFSETKISDESIEEIIDNSMLHAISFDLQTPPYRLVSEVSVDQMMESQNNLNISTSKRLGFKFQHEQTKNVK